MKPWYNYMHLHLIIHTYLLIILYVVLIHIPHIDTSQKIFDFNEMGYYSYCRYTSSISIVNLHSYHTKLFLYVKINTGIFVLVFHSLIFIRMEIQWLNKYILRNFLSYINVLQMVYCNQGKNTTMQFLHRECLCGAC
jgi:hypothetical protein